MAIWPPEQVTTPEYVGQDFHPFLAPDLTNPSDTIDRAPNLPGPRGFIPSFSELVVLSSVQRFSSTPYGDYRIMTSFLQKPNTVTMRASQPGVPHQVIQTTAPFTMKVIDWQCSRLGVPPDLPYWDTGDSNDVLIARRIQPMSPRVMPMGNILEWSCRGTYVYHNQIALDPASPLNTGVTPIDGGSVRQFNGYNTNILKSTGQLP